MATFNVNREVKDSFYRYKMPRLVAKVEGKGNGIKTVLVNMADIAKSLQRPPTYPTKFFGCELGAQTQFDDKNARYIVNGAHDADKLQILLDGFIKKFVLCPQCSNPETNLTIDKHQNIWSNCIACGHRGMLDMKHKLTTFILKNPPSGAVDHGTGKAVKEGTKGEKTEDDKKSKKSKKDTATPSTENGVAPAETPVKSSKKSKKEEAEDEDDGDWSMDTSAEAVKARREKLEAELGEAGAKLAAAGKEPTKDALVEKLFAFMQQSKKTPKDIFNEAKKLDIVEEAIIPILNNELSRMTSPDEQMCAAALAQKKSPFIRYLFGQFKNYMAADCKLFRIFALQTDRTRRIFLGGIERIATYSHPLMGEGSNFAHVLKELYDCEILDEEGILAYAAEAPTGEFVPKEATEKLLKSGAKFIEWLKDADDESEEEEDVSEPVSTSRGPATPVAPKPADEINIDDI